MTHHAAEVGFRHVELRGGAAEALSCTGHTGKTSTEHTATSSQWPTTADRKANRKHPIVTTVRAAPPQASDCALLRVHCQLGCAGAWVLHCGQPTVRLSQ